LSRVFVDTSAVLALLSPTDDSHEPARRVFLQLQARAAPLVTTSFVLTEIYALLGRRLGLEAIDAFRSNFAPLLEVIWVGAELHEAGLDLLLGRRIRDLSLVDTVSFLAMRQRHIDEAFVFDRHFRDEGFTVMN
jgi:predicted nucleic acid-binding protein